MSHKTKENNKGIKWITYITGVSWDKREEERREEKRREKGRESVWLGAQHLLYADLLSLLAPRCRARQYPMERTYHHRLQTVSRQPGNRNRFDFHGACPHHASSFWFLLRDQRGWVETTATCTLRDSLKSRRPMKMGMWEDANERSWSTQACSEATIAC